MLSQQNLKQAILEIGAEFPIRRDPDFYSIAHLIALSEVDRSRKETARLKQSFTDRTKELDPKSDKFARMAEEHQRLLERNTSFNPHHIRQEWFRASRSYGYICREQGKPKEPSLRHPRFWLEVKRLVTEEEWRRMWSSGRIRQETLSTIRQLLIQDQEREARLMRTVDFAIFERRNPAYDEETRIKTKNKRRGRRPRNRR